MTVHPRAGEAAPADLLINVAHLEREYYARRPDLHDPRQLVRFGTSGHRGSSLQGTFTDAHVAAIMQAIVDYRHSHNIRGPLYMGKDTHALSALAQTTALEVLAANDVDTFIQEGHGATPTPVISRAILEHNRQSPAGFADGVVITPSHNPPEDGGLKYNPPNGGPADTEVTKWVQDRAIELLGGENHDVKRIPIAAAIKASSTHQEDFVRPYVKDLRQVVDMDAIRASGLSLGVDPLGGAGLQYWEQIKETYHLNLTVVNPRIDSEFGFMTLDHDGKIRMDCSSPYAMAGLVQLKDKYHIGLGNDPDADRHGIVTPSVGLMNPNHFLAVCINYPLTNRPLWPREAAVGKTVVSSNMIDRVVASLKRRVIEVPVGFKWFAPGLFAGWICFCGEESAGGSFLRTDGTAWTTDKDGIILGLLAAEITARTGKDPGIHYQELTAAFGSPQYTRIDAPATLEEKVLLQNLSPEAIKTTHLAGEPITATLTRAPGNDAPIGGLKVASANGWFAARPSGTENVYKVYAESFRSEERLKSIVREAQEIVAQALAAPGTQRAGARKGAIA